MIDEKIKYLEDTFYIHTPNEGKRKLGQMNNFQKEALFYMIKQQNAIIYGARQLGKTTLAKAYTKLLMDENPGINIAYVESSPAIRSNLSEHYEFPEQFLRYGLELTNQETKSKVTTYNSSQLEFLKGMTFDHMIFDEFEFYTKFDGMDELLDAFYKTPKIFISSYNPYATSGYMRERFKQPTRKIFKKLYDVTWNPAYSPEWEKSTIKSIGETAYNIEYAMTFLK